MNDGSMLRTAAAPVDSGGMFGSHLSIAGGMVNALREAQRLKLDCVQVFTANQRQWNPKSPNSAEQAEWLDELKAMGWDSLPELSNDPPRVVSHNSYLINLASPDSAAWAKSLAAMRDELQRCEALHIPLCVMHPGAHLGEPRDPKSRNQLEGKFTADERAGMGRIIKALDQLHSELRGFRVITCLEATVGSGTNLGYDFHQLAFLRGGVTQPERVGFCFDTCHVTAAGYDMTTDGAAAVVLNRWDALCGAANLRVFHFNDSEGGVGSRKDRHAHVGDGCCGEACFRTLLNHPAFAAVPKILETPKETTAKGTPWDMVNIRRLKRLVEPSRSNR